MVTTISISSLICQRNRCLCPSATTCLAGFATRIQKCMRCCVQACQIPLSITARFKVSALVIAPVSRRNCLPSLIGMSTCFSSSQRGKRQTRCTSKSSGKTIRPPLKIFLESGHLSPFINKATALSHHHLSLRLLPLAPSLSCSFHPLFCLISTKQQEKTLKN